MKFKLRREIEIEAPDIKSLKEIVARDWKIIKINKLKNKKEK